jgi:hypothetical protein
VALLHCELVGVLLEEPQGEGEKLAECVWLPHWEMEGVKLANTLVEPLRLVVTEEEEEGVHEEDCVPLPLLNAEALCAAVAQALSVALSHCEREGVKLEECVVLPH